MQFHAVLDIYCRNLRYLLSFGVHHIKRDQFLNIIQIQIKCYSMWVGFFFQETLSSASNKQKFTHKRVLKRLKKKSDINMKFFQAWAKCCFTWELEIANLSYRNPHTHTNLPRDFYEIDNFVYIYDWLTLWSNPVISFSFPFVCVHWPEERPAYCPLYSDWLLFENRDTNYSIWCDSMFFLYFLKYNIFWETLPW